MRIVFAIVVAAFGMVGAVLQLPSSWSLSSSSSSWFFLLSSFLLLLLVDATVDWQLAVAGCGRGCTCCCCNLLRA